MSLKAEKISVLILGGGLQGLSVAYSLYKIGYTAFVYSHEKVFKKCKFVTGLADFSKLSAEEVSDFIKEKDISVVIPTGDKIAAWLSENKQELQSKTGAVCAVEDYDKFNKASTKSTLLSICQSNGISVPKTVPLNEGRIEPAAQFVGFPALIKPDHSVGARGITKVQDIESIKRDLPDIEAKYGTCSLQEYVENRDFYFNVMLYRYRDGSYAPSVIIKILRFYPVTGGSSSLCVTVEDSQLEALCRKTLDVLDWHGFADFDVLYDKKDGKYKIIEINPRVPASLRAADVSGINYPQIIVRDALGLAKPDMKYSTGMYLRYLGLDIMWFFKSGKRFSTTPGWFKFFGKNLFYQDMYKDDWKMSFYTMWEGVRKIFRDR
jgi:predicted ATP-grasp superfamily ATP-dependent carboligase